MTGASPMRLVERDGFLAAEVEDDDARPLTVEEVRELLERVRRPPVGAVVAGARPATPALRREPPA